MGARQRDWANRARARLVEALGSACARCGSTERLELDCISPRGDLHHKLDPARRVSFYRLEHAAGNLQVLCEPCHDTKTNSERPTIARPRPPAWNRRTPRRPGSGARAPRPPALALALDDPPADPAQLRAALAWLESHPTTAAPADYRAQVLAEARAAGLLPAA